MRARGIVRLTTAAVLVHAAASIAGAGVLPADSSSYRTDFTWSYERPALDHPASILLTNAIGDTVELEANSLSRIANQGLMAVTNARSRLSWKLRDGSDLRVSESTPAGLYQDANGDPLWVAPGISYPRYVQAVTHITRECAFVVWSGARMGLLVTPTSGPTSPESYLQVLARAGRWAWDLGDQDMIAALECPEDGPTRYALVFNSKRTAPAVVTWFAYDGDHRGSGAQRQTGVRVAGGRAEWRSDRAPPPAEYPWALSTRAGRVAPRVVGSVLVDPVHNTIVKLP
jgi:hypothetical protein